jgi:ribosomal protein L16/L10AE
MQYTVPHELTKPQIEAARLALYQHVHKETGLTLRQIAIEVLLASEKAKEEA